jgi:predicted MFS family arabinose efflux permease
MACQRGALVTPAAAWPGCAASQGYGSASAGSQRLYEELLTVTHLQPCRGRDRLPGPQAHYGRAGVSLDMAHETPGRLRSYRRLFAIPGSRGLAAADLCARLPQGMLSLTVLLVVAQHAPMRVAGLALAGCTLGLAATGPPRGRLADRYGMASTAAVCGLGHLAALLALLAASLARQPAPALVALATAAGCLMPPLSPGLRSLWSRQVPGPLLPTAFAFDAAVFDLAYIAGPVMASSLAVGAAPAAALGLMLALTAAAVLLVGVSFGHERASQSRDAGPRPLRSAALRRLLITGALANAALSATEVGIIGCVRLHGALWASGPLLAELSAGSILGSLLLGTRPPGASAQRRLLRLLAGYALGLVALAAAGLYPPLLAVAAPIAGLCLGPTLATLFTMTASAAPRGSATETQAWLNSVMNGGAAGGAALAGLTAAQPVLGLALAASAAALAAVTAAVLGRAARSGEDGRPRPGGPRPCPSGPRPCLSGPCPDGPGTGDRVRPGTGPSPGLTA